VPKYSFCYPNLTTISVNPDNPDYTSKDGILYNKEMTKLLYYPNGRQGDYVFPDTVKKIHYFAFSEPTCLKSISIHASLTDIDDVEYIFATCYSLTSITVHPDNPHYTSENGVLYNKDKTKLICYPRTKQGDFSIPDTITEIGKCMFSNCVGLTSVNIPNSVVKITESAFENCVNLTSIVIPDTVKKIEQGAFMHCDNLKYVELSKSITEIEHALFWGCLNLAYINIPDSVTKISSMAFIYCEKLTSIVIPDSVDEIGGQCFKGCYALKSIFIPASVIFIDNAFDDCPAYITVHHDNPAHKSVNGKLKWKRKWRWRIGKKELLIDFFKNNNKEYQKFIKSIKNENDRCIINHYARTGVEGS